MEISPTEVNKNLYKPSKKEWNNKAVPETSGKHILDWNNQKYENCKGISNSDRSRKQSRESCGGEKLIIYLHYSSAIRIWTKNGSARACQRSVKNLQAQTLQISEFWRNTQTQASC